MIRIKKKITGVVIIAFVCNFLNLSPQMLSCLRFETARAAVENYDIGNVLWEANIDSGAVTTFTQKDTIRGTTTYMVDPTASYGVSGNTEAAPSGADGNVLRFTHTKDNVNYATWVELARGTESNGIKPTGTNKVLITEARIFISSDIVDLMLMNYHMQDIYTLKKGFEYLTIPAAQRVGKSGKWILIKSVLDTSDGSYKIYFDGTELASGTVENLSSIQTKGMWPQLRAFANDPAVAANADLAASEYMLIDYFRVGEPEGTTQPTATPGATQTSSPTSTPSVTATPVPTATVTPAPTSNVSSGIQIENVLWETDFKDDDVPSNDYTSYKSLKNNAVFNTSNGKGTIVEVANLPQEVKSGASGTKVAKLTSTTGYSPVDLQLAAAQTNGIKPRDASNTSKTLITETKIWVSDITKLYPIVFNMYWTGSNISKAVEEPQVVGFPKDILPSGTWMTYKMVLKLSTGDFKLYVDGMELRSGNISGLIPAAKDLALASFAANGMWPMLRAYSNVATSSLNPAPYMYIDYIRVGEALYPEVTGSIPENGAVNVAVNTRQIKVNFNRKMDSSSLNPDNIKLIDYVKDSEVSYGSYRYQEGENAYIMELSADLDFSTKYKIFVSQNVKSANSVNIQQDREIIFSTSDMIGAESLRFTKNGTQDITVTGLTGGMISGNIRLKNNDKIEQNATVIAVLYKVLPDADALMTFVYSQEAIPAGVSREVSIPQFNVPDNSRGGYKIRIYVVKSLTSPEAYINPRVFDSGGVSVE